MRELIIHCDHCGKVIKGNPYKVRLEQEDRDTEDFITDLTEEQQKVGDMDWCENCFGNLTAFLLDTAHHLLAAPPVQEKFDPEVFQATVISEPVENVIKEPEIVSEPPEEVSDSDGSGGTEEKNQD